MRTFVEIVRYSAALGTGLFMLSATNWAVAEDIAGKFTAKYSKQEAVPVVGSEGHVLILETAEGKNTKTGGSAAFDGASVTLQETLDLDRGNGDQTGYITLTNDGSSATSRYNGRVTTTVVDGKQHTSGDGSWTIVSGTGDYVNAKGQGTYTFTLTSQTELTSEWKGQMSR
jgi:hypothetical protein